MGYDDLSLAAAAAPGDEAPLELPDRVAPQEPPLELPDKAPKLERAWSSVARMDPARTAEVVGLARRLQEPEAFIDKNLGDVKIAAGAPAAALFREIETQRPATSRFLEDPKMLASVKDDLENLTLHERLVNGYHRVVDGLRNDWRVGQLQAERSLIGFTTIPGFSKLYGSNEKLGQDPSARVREIDKELSGIGGYGPLGFGDKPVEHGFIRRSIDGAIEMAPMILGGLEYGAAGALATGTAAAATAGGVAAAGSLFVPPAMAVAPAAAALSAGAVGARTGFAAGEAFYNFKYSAGEAYLALRAIVNDKGEPIPEDIAAPIAISIGAVNAGLGLVQLSQLLKTFPAGKAFLARLTATEGAKVLEPVTFKAALVRFATNELKTSGQMGAIFAGMTGVQVAGEAYAKALAGGEFPAPAETASQRLAQAFVSGAGIGAVLGLPGLSWTFAEDAYRARQIAHTQELYRALGDTAGASKLRERLPEAHRKFVADLTRDTPVQAVYIPVDAVTRYFQSENIDPARAMEELGARASFEEARQTGNPVKVELPAFTEKLVGTKHYAALADDVKFDPEGWTANERKAKLEEVAQAVQQTQEQAAEAVKADAEVRVAHDAVLEDVKTKLLRAKPSNFSEAQWRTTAETEARVVAALAVSRAKKRGISVDEAWRTLEHEILGPADVYAEEGDVTFEFGEAASDFKDGLAAAGAAADRQLLEESGLTPVMEEIRKLGGIDPEDAAQAGWKGEIPDMEAFGIFRTKGKGGQRVDHVAESLAARGLLPESDKNLMAEVLRDEALKISNFKAEHGEAAYEALRRKRTRLSQGAAEEGSTAGSPGSGGDPGRSDTGAPKARGSSSRISVDPNIADVKARAEDWLGKEAALRGMENDDRFKLQFGTYVHRAVNNLTAKVARDFKALPDEAAKVAFLESDAYSRAGMAADVFGKKLASLREAYPEIYKQIPHADPTQEASILEGFKQLGDDALYQSKAPAPTFYSRLERAIEKRLPEKATAGQVEAILREGNREERKWSGVDEFLAGKEKVSRAELLEFLRANQLQIEETVLGGDKRSPLEDIRLEMDNVSDELAEKGYGVELEPGGMPGEIQLTDRFGEVVDEPPADVAELAGRYADLSRRRDNAQNAGVPDGTKYNEYALPGGENYRELLLKLPRKTSLTPEESRRLKLLEDTVREDGWESLSDAQERALHELRQGVNSDLEFRSQHFDELNVLAHVRFNDRRSADGKKILFIEELQSDWHQKGRRYGYQDTPRLKELPSEYSISESQSGRFGKLFSVSDSTGKVVAAAETRNEAIALALDKLNAPEGRVPDAPFKKTWHEFALKRMIRYAAENDYDVIGWTTGEQQAARYDLSKQVSTIRYYPESGRLIAFGLGDRPDRIIDQVIQREQLPDVIGKDAADKLDKIEPGFDPHTESGGSKVKILKNAELKIGGEGMKGFYDKIIPNFLRKFGKRFGADVGEATIAVGADEKALRRAQHGGDSAAIAGALGGREQIHSMELTPELKRAALQEGLPLFQGEGGGERGFSEPERRIIGLMSRADASTYLHEVAHLWLHTEHEYVRSGKADEKSLADWHLLSDWLEIKEGQERLTRDQQEQFARGFEAYLREGKAPSDGLRGAFSRLRGWLTRIYRSAKGLDVELSDPVRGVMDRMLAAEDEILRASTETGHIASEIESLAGVSPEAKKRAKTLEERAHDFAVQELVRQQMEELKGQNREFLERERERLTKRHTALVEEMPIYRAESAMIDVFGAGAKLRKALETFLEGKLDDVEKVKELEVAAEVYDFASGRELAQKLLELKPSAEEISRRVREELAGYADLRNTAIIRERAEQLVHSEYSLEREALAAQIYEDLARNKEIRTEVVKRQRIETSALMAAAREQARRLIAAKPFHEAGAFRPYVTAERNSALRVEKARARGDLAAAAAARREKLLNHALYIEAQRAKKEADGHLEYIGKFERRGRDLLDMPYGFTSAIDGLLRRFGFPASPEGDPQTLAAIAADMLRKGESAEEIANATGLKQGKDGAWAPESLVDLLNRINEEYYALSLPQEILTGGRANSRQLTLGELRLVRETVEAVASVGKGYTRFLSDFIKGDIKEAAAAFRTSLEASIGTPYAEKLKIGSASSSRLEEAVDAVLSLPDVLAADLVNLLTLVTYLDGGKEDGPAHQYIYRPLKRAEDAKLARYEKMTKEINGIFESHFHPSEAAALKSERIAFSFGVAGGRRWLSKEEILAIGLNWGNEGNRDRIRRGYFGGMDPQTADLHVRTILDTINKEGWEFIQQVWDHLDTYWPEIAKLEMKVNGVEPQRVEHAAVETRYGTYRGGYYPIAYDFQRSSDAFRTAEQRNELYRRYSTAAAHTETGHTQARVSAVNRPIRLSLDILFGHLENVVHDLEYRAAVIDVQRFLKQRDVRVALDNAIGPRGAKMIGDALKDVASEQGEFLNTADKVFRWFRFNATFSTLGLRVFTLPMDVTGNLINGLWEIGPSRMASAVTQFVSNPSELKAFVDEKSERMRHRAKLRDRDVADISRKWTGNESAFKQYAFIVQALADEAVSYPLWAEVYKRAVAEHGAEKAKDIADETVARTIGSGSRLDQVAAQKGSESKKILTMYYSWMSMMFNRFWLESKRSGLQYSKGNTGAAIATMAKATFFAWGLQAINENFWREFFRNSQNEDPDERKRRVLARVLQQPFSYVWIARDIGGFLVDQATGKQDVSYRLSPLEASVEALLKPAGRGLNIAFSDNKEADEKFGESVARSASLALGYPQQLNNLVFNFYDWIQGNGELTWRDFLTRRTKR